jgi:hypothetical protein
MCHEWFSRHERRREERFDEELRYLFDEEVRQPKPTPIAENELDEERLEQERAPVEASTR